jgi:CheY-like chemotaxis protein
MLQRIDNLKVLLAEDNLVNQKVATVMLGKLHCEVTVAANGVEAVAKHAAEDWDLIFMDCQMPELDGFGTTRDIRAREAGGPAHLPIIAMTANAMEGDRERCLEAGMDDYIAKPVTNQELKRVLSTRAGASR